MDFCLILFHEHFAVNISPKISWLGVKTTRYIYVLWLTDLQS